MNVLMYIVVGLLVVYCVLWVITKIRDHKKKKGIKNGSCSSCGSSDRDTSDNKKID